MVDEVGLVNAEHVLEFLCTHQLVSRVDARWVELDVKWLSVTSHQTPWHHQQKRTNLKTILNMEKIFTIKRVLSRGAASILAVPLLVKEFPAQQHQKIEQETQEHQKRRHQRAAPGSPEHSGPLGEVTRAKETMFGDNVGGPASHHRLPEASQASRATSQARNEVT